MNKENSNTSSFDYQKVEDAIRKMKNIDDMFAENGPLQIMFKSTIEQLLKEEMKQHLGYEYNDARNKNTDNSRNGHYKKTIKTGGGKIEVEVPRDRDGSFEPVVLPKGKTTTSNLEDQIISMYARGMTTTDIASHLKHLYLGVDVSPSFISSVSNKIITLAKEWESRPLEKLYPVIYLDAIHFKVRDNGKIVCKAAYICLGLKIDGTKDVLGIYIGENESSKFWLSVLTDLNNRGVEDILIACIDGLKGFPEAIKSIFPKTEIQLCIIHQIRNSLKYSGSKHQKEFMSDLKLVYKADTKDIAETKLLELSEKWGAKYPVVINSWNNNWDNLSEFYKYTAPIRKMIYTTNIIEGFNRQLRKVTKNRSVFPNNDSLTKLLYLATINASEKWTVPRQGWAEAISQLAIHFEGRLDLGL
jgi:putative transposase